MAEVLYEMSRLMRNSWLTMLAIIVVFFVATQAVAQDHMQALSTATPNLPAPFLDLFSSVGNYYNEPIRKTSYSEAPYHSSSYVSCPKQDSLSSFASILGSAAKIMLSAAIILFLKILVGKLMLLPFLMLVMAKIGLKAVLLWPMITKMVKYFKKKKIGKSRMIMDCSQRIACVMQRASREGWTGNLGAAVTFSLIDDVNEDSSFAEFLLSIFTNNKVAQCMSMECSAGTDIS